jgi:hypothetical protein
MSDDRTLGSGTSPEPPEKYLDLERHGHREVFRIPVSDWENKSACGVTSLKRGLTMSGKSG